MVKRRVGSFSMARSLGAAAFISEFSLGEACRLPLYTADMWMNERTYGRANAQNE